MWTLSNSKYVKETNSAYFFTETLYVELQELHLLNIKYLRLLLF